MSCHTAEILKGVVCGNVVETPMLGGLEHHECSVVPLYGNHEDHACPCGWKWC